MKEFIINHFDVVVGIATMLMIRFLFNGTSAEGMLAYWLGMILWRQQFMVHQCSCSKKTCDRLEHRD